MSFLAIDEIRGKTSGTPTDVNDLKYQLATAWVNFSGIGTVAIRDSYNVSSITDNKLGDYTVNFSTAMDNTDYSLGLSVSATGSEIQTPAENEDRTRSTGGVSVLGLIHSGTVSGTRAGERDIDFYSVQIFGGLN